MMNDGNGGQEKYPILAFGRGDIRVNVVRDQDVTFDNGVAFVRDVQAHAIGTAHEDQVGVALDELNTVVQFRFEKVESIDVVIDALESVKTSMLLADGSITAGQDGFGFDAALNLLKKGHKLARKGWNGAGMFVYLVPAASYPATTEHARKHFGDVVPYRQYLALKTAQNDVATWAPSGSDALAEDWIVIE